MFILGSFGRQIRGLAPRCVLRARGAMLLMLGIVYEEKYNGRQLFVCLFVRAGRLADARPRSYVADFSRRTSGRRYSLICIATFNGSHLFLRAMLC